jgi:hypothetical protein
MLSLVNDVKIPISLGIVHPFVISSNDLILRHFSREGCLMNLQAISSGCEGVAFFVGALLGFLIRLLVVSFVVSLKVSLEICLAFCMEKRQNMYESFILL